MIPDDHHLTPLSSYSSPTRRTSSAMFVASDDATAGSVIRKAERISPSRSGRSHRSRCAAEPYRASTSMFPVSGAEQLNTSDAKKQWPMISASGA